MKKQRWPKEIKKAPNEAWRESQAKWQNQKFCCKEKFKEKYAEHKYKLKMLKKKYKLIKKP